MAERFLQGRSLANSASSASVSRWAMPSRVFTTRASCVEHARHSDVGGGDEEAEAEEEEDDDDEEEEDEFDRAMLLPSGGAATTRFPRDADTGLEHVRPAVWLLAAVVCRRERRGFSAIFLARGLFRVSVTTFQFL